MEAKITEKNWSREIEKEIYEKWKKEDKYQFNRNSGKKVYSIDTPPPYVNTPVHVGQATTYVLMDMFARFRRMMGYEILFPLGLDRNGLPIEMAAEKKFSIKLTETPREKFIEFCRKVLEESSLESTESFLRLGISFNSWKVGFGLGEIYMTDSPDYRALTQETFIEMYKKGLIYEDERVNNWCPGCETTIADAEIDYEEFDSFFNDIKFKIKETGEEVIIATTRPELICTCGMVIFNPDDDRYKHLEGLTAITPIFNKEVPIRAHPIAEIEKGSGLMMMCSFGDVSDIRFFREMNLKAVIAINKDGTMNENAGILNGMKIKEAQKFLVMELDKKGLLAKQKRITHRTPICERSKDPIEFISMKEFYVKQVEYKSKIMEISDKISFYAPESKQILIDWINSVSIDWPISRRRYYATEVPLWYCKKCHYVFVPEPGPYYQPWKQKPKIDKCPDCGSEEFIGEERVCDTWFDSSNSPLYVLKYKRDEEFFNKHLPCTLRPQGKEIIRTWLYYTLLKDYLLTGKCIFKDAWINYHILDEQGTKMSKSLGNVIDPKDILDKFGAEPFRLWTVTEGNLDRTDFRCSFERIEGSGKTISKLWNVSKFVSMFPPESAVELTELDKWIISEVNSLIVLCREQYDKYNFHNPAVNLKHFLWETFASNYLELVKNRAYNSDKFFSDAEKQSALYTLNYCLDTFLKLFSPILPLLTYKIYYDLRHEDIHFTEFPRVEHNFKPGFSTEKLMEINSLIWKAKKEKGFSLKEPVSKVFVPEELKAIEKDFIKAHNIKEIKYSDKFSIEL